MAKLTLVIGNKNYSSWSMRPWVLLTQFGIEFQEILLKFHSPEWDARIATLSPSGLVPVLWEGEPGSSGSHATWDSLAIMERVAELFPEHAIWPRDPRARARARSAAAEMHGGFRALRTTMPMNLRAQHAGKGYTPDAAANIQRIETLFAACRAEFGASGPYLFGGFSATDAMFAPVVMRFATYAPPLAPATMAYCNALREAHAMRAWAAGAAEETEFVAEDEPYATAP